jgi:hypothetical protein
MIAARSLAVLGVAGVLGVPVPAAAAPAPCEGAEAYAAESGAELLAVNRLDLRPEGGSGDPVTGVGVGEAKSALVADAALNAAAVARMLDGQAADKSLTRMAEQDAPPGNAAPTTVTVPARDAGPLSLGAGTLAAHAVWRPGMACGRAYGEATRAGAALGGARVLRGQGGSALAAVPETIRSTSTTVLERHGGAARTVASAGVSGAALELLGGAVHVRIERSPTLTTSMATAGGGDVRYVPAALEVSGTGLAPRRLDAAGEAADLTVPERESAPAGSLAGLGAGPALPLPGVPGLPPVARPPAPARTEAAGPGTRVRISVGDVRQATRGHAVAARATALTIRITRGEDRTRRGYGHSAGVVLDLSVGVLESAAVAPERGARGVREASAGAGGALPITGPGVDGLALAGGVLLAAGAAAALGGRRRRRP